MPDSQSKKRMTERQISLPFKSSSLDNAVEDNLIKVRKKKFLWLKYLKKFKRDFKIDRDEGVIRYTKNKPRCSMRKEQEKKIQFSDIVETRKRQKALKNTRSMHILKQQKQKRKHKSVNSRNG